LRRRLDLGFWLPGHLIVKPANFLLDTIFVYGYLVNQKVEQPTPEANMIRVADIIESEDDGGWYARVDDYDPNEQDAVAAFKHVAESRVLSTKSAAEAFARQKGATRLMYP
jgi:hypothetical protein